MKTARFATVVEKFGEPEAHLVLTDPAKDRTLQEAVKSNRLMTVFQQNVGTRADQGAVGFKAGNARQFLIFPKPLKGLDDARIVGIKYDLWKTKEIPKSERAKLGRQPTKPKKEKPKAQKEARAPSNVIHFEKSDQDEEDNEAVAEIKKKIRRAMAALEQGKQVAAFNLLKQIVESS